MDKVFDILSDFDAKILAALLAGTLAVLANAWWISLKIITELKIIAHELEGNKDDHVVLRKDSAEVKEEMKATCDHVMSVNEQQWTKLVEHRIDLTKHDGRIASLEDKCNTRSKS